MDIRYDPNIPSNRRERHREMLMGGSNFKQVVPVKDEEVLQKIHECYRLEYLKDMILGPRCTYSSAFNNVSIMSVQLQEYHSYGSLTPQENHSKIDARL